MYGYIYITINKIDGKTYVGKHKLYKRSWNNDNYLGSGKLLNLALKKYSKENFEKFLICYTESEKDACEKEEFWIAHYKAIGKAEYNIAKGGQGGGHPSVWKDKHLSEKIRKKISETLKGNNNKKGKHCSEETRKRLSEAAKNRPSNRKGKHHSEATRRKMSESQKLRRAKEKGDNLCA